MPIKIIIIPDNKVIEYELSSDQVRVSEIINFLAKAEGTSINAYVVMKENEILTEDDMVLDGEIIEVYRVASGG